MQSFHAAPPKATRYGITFTTRPRCSAFSDLQRPPGIATLSHLLVHFRPSTVSPADTRATPPQQRSALSIVGGPLHPV
eukprot:313046-Prymnesium_polylepis.1